MSFFFIYLFFFYVNNIILYNCSTLGKAMILFLLIYFVFTLFQIPVVNSVALSINLGNKILRDSNYEQLKNERIAVLSNPTGIFSDTLEHIVDNMHNIPDLNLIAIFSPEHGFRGEKQAETGNNNMILI